MSDNELHGPYQNAYAHVGRVRDFVTENIDDARENAALSREEAFNTLEQLSSFTPDFGFSGNEPDAPEVNFNLEGSIDLPEIQSTDFGQIHDVSASLSGLRSITAPEAVEIDPFAPSVQSINIPPTPVPVSVGDVPERPELDDIVLPDSPVIDRPDLPALEQISIPDFEFPTLPIFDEKAPEFKGTPVSEVLQWHEPDYHPEVMDEVIGILREMWSGNSGIPPAIEQALWEREASREDLDAARQISAAQVEFSSRGYTMPPGMLAARTDAIREESQIKKQSAGRDIAIRMAELQIENIKFAVEQGVAAENTLFNIWSNIAQRQFEAARVQMDSQLALYNAQVSLFNAKQSAYATRAQVYKTKLDAELSRIDVFRAELEGEKTKGEINQQKVQIYSERIRALLSDLEIYKAEMQGASLQSDHNRNRIDTYRADLQGFAEKINADKTRFDAYEAQVRGELGKAQIMDTEARAYSAYISGKSTEADISTKQMESDIAYNEQKIREYQAALDADKAKIQASLSKIEAGARAYTADTQRFIAEAGAEEARHKVGVAAQEANARATIGIYETNMRKYIADTEQVIRKASIQLEALKSAGQVGSTLAAGAMAGVSIGATLNGSGSVSASGRSSSSRSASQSYNYRGTADDGDPLPPIANRSI